jgi:hypothetical protein
MILNSIVVLSLHSPKEKIWGELLVLSPAGITIRGVGLTHFEELLRQAAAGEAGAGSLSTVFYPSYRVERMALDEGIPEAPSLAERFRLRMGIPVQEFFRAE